MAKKILIVGLELASDDVTHEEYTSRASLLDWDIVLFKPSIGEFITNTDQYKGKPSLSDSRSFQLKEASEHWRREIRQAFESGKTVILFLAPIEEVYIDTGERRHSGTGRNRATTRIVEPYSNYNCVPASLVPTNARGTAVKLAGKSAEVMAPYWSEFSAYSEYQVLLNGADIPACLLTCYGDKPVGALFKSKTSSGSLVCFPDIDFYRDGFLEESEKKEEDNGEEEDEFWTAEAKQFASRMISAVVALDLALHSDGEMTPEPAWASNSTFSLAAERALGVELLAAESQLEEAQKRKEAIVERLRTVGQLRGLLYEKGKPLEKAIIDALRLLGFSAQPYKEGSSEFDVVFESAEGRLIGEAEGKDNKAINVDKLRQLAMNIHEDLNRDEVTAPAKGVLFGNGFRLQPPHKREAAFTKKCITAAQSSSTSLIATQDLFRVARYLSDHKDDTYATECRKAILSSMGLVSLPETPPQEEQEVSDVRE